jgi:TonB family protein
MSETWKQWVGQVVNGQFPLQRYLGGSDHSAVFLTERIAGLGKAAIKLLPADPKTTESQLFRWKLATKLPHPRLLPIFEMGQCELGGTNLLYVVMEYAEEDLAQVLPQRPLTPAEARQMLPPVLDALAYVHEKGFVHGRIQPANIMAVCDRVKISSDSLCPSTEPQAHGKPRAYDPPEVAAGQTSVATDVWSLGVTLVEVLTQRLPVLQGTESAPALPEGLPQPFLDIARHCLHPDPQRRWSVADIAARLKSDSLSAAKHAASSPIAPGAGKRSSARYLVPIAVGVALVMLAGSRMRTSPPQAQPEAAQPASPAAPQAEPNQKPTPVVRAASSSAKVDEGAPAATPSPPLSSKEAGGVTAQAMGRKAAGANPKTLPAGVVPGVIVRQVVPDVPQRARDTIEGHVKVRVRIAVDTSGNVAGATLESAGPSKYFARLALEAAKGWRFTPPQASGQPASSEWILHFSFGRTAVDVHPTQVAP